MSEIEPRPEVIERWLELAREKRYFGMKEDKVRENLERRGLSSAVADRVVREVFSEDNRIPDPIAADPAVTPESQQPRLVGVGGWLLFLVAGLLILGPILGAGRIFLDIAVTETQYPALVSNPSWASFKAGIWVCFLTGAGLSIYAGWGLAKGRTWAVVKRAKIVLWLSGPAMALVMGTVVPLLTLGGVNADPQFIGGFIGSVLLTWAWTAYLSKSKRVRNTYGPQA